MLRRETGRGTGPATREWLLLAVLCAAAAVTVTVLGTRLTFFNDDWYFLLQRPGLESHGGLDTLLAPHNGNMVVLLAALYKLFVAIFGLGSQLPFRIVIGLTTAALGALVFLLVRRRLGTAIGLAAAMVVMFLGPASEDFLFFGAMMDIGSSLAFGLAALLAMEVDSPRRNAVACGLLVCSLLFSNAGIPFLVGALVLIAARGRPRQLWIPALPALLFGVWWAFYASSGRQYVTITNVEHLPRYVADSASVNLASITGLNHGTLAAVLSRGHILLAAFVVLLLVWLFLGGRPRRSSVAVGATMLAFWILTGASYIPGRDPIASRYQLLGGTLLILFAAGVVADGLAGWRGGVVGSRGVVVGSRRLGRPERPGRVLAAVVCVAAIVITASNLEALAKGYRFFATQSEYAKADLGALEIAGRRAPPSVWLVAIVARNPYLSGVTAGRYFDETSAHGSPAFYSPAEILSAKPAERTAADSVLASAYGIRPLPPVGGISGVHGCSTLLSGRLSAPAVPGSEVASDGGALQLTNRSPMALVVGVRRFATPATPVYVGFLGRSRSIALRIPRDSLALPWRVSVLSPPGDPIGRAAVCRR